MIRINLLPHREARRKERRRQFYVVSGLMLALGAVIGLAGHMYMADRVEQQNSRNNFLKSEIRKLDTEIAEIQRLRGQIEALLGRKQVIEGLQGARVQPVHLFNDLVSQMPEGVYLLTLRQSGARVTLNGHAQSNARVSHLMRSLEGSEYMSNAGLVEVKSAVVADRRLSDFTLNIELVRPSADDESEESN